MAKIVELKSTNNEKLYPITKIEAVYGDNGANIETLLSNERTQRIIGDESTSNQLSSIEARVNLLSNLAEGSTTGDAELMDIRVGADGMVYDNAGSAVRIQIRNIDELTQQQQIELSNLTIDVQRKIDDAYVEDGFLYMTSEGEVVVGPLGPFSGTGGGGSGGGSTTNAEMKLTNTAGWISKSISVGEDCEIKFNWYSREDELETGSGNMVILVNSQQKVNMTIPQGDISYNVGPFLSVGKNTIRVTITDSYGTIRNQIYTINSQQFIIESSFDPNTQYSGPFIFSYTPTGTAEKTTYFILDGVNIGTDTVTTTGRQINHTIPAQKHGAHTLSVFFEAVVAGETVRSNELYYEFMSVEEGNNTPIITTSFNKKEVDQYSMNPISYRVYTPGIYTSDIDIYINDEKVTSLTVDRTVQTYPYSANDAIPINFKIVTGSVERVIYFEVNEVDMDVEAETEALSLYLSAYGRSNFEANPRTWSFGDISTKFTNFNMTSDGWQIDNQGSTILRVSGDARLKIPYKPFATDARANGMTIELEFATRNVLNYDAEIISCMNNNRGFSLTAQKAILKSEQSEISTQYKEDEHVRIAFVIEKQSKNRLLYIYINGIMSGVKQYPADDDFSQTVPQDILIGSNDCTIDIYNIRIYDNDLTRFQVVDNWIADTQDGELKYQRYLRNNIFDAYGSIIIENLPKDLPYMIIESLELPQYKGNKKTIKGTFVNPNDAARSFAFENAEADVQGTSSQYYPRKNYKIKFKGGFLIMEEQSSTYAMNENAIPTKTFTFKADFASSEGANNVELARLYNDICPYKTPYQKADSRVRQGIDGFPIVIFQNDGEKTTFIGKYNFNNDKGTEEVFGFTEGDESWEIKNNTGYRVVFKDDHYGVEYVDEEGVVHTADEWLNDFEGRFPDGNEDYTNLAALANWLRSTDTEQATNDILPSPVTYGEETYTNDTASYREAKFKYELTDHMEKDAVVFYYLFTDIFLMVDSRAKNAFPTFMGKDKWFSLPYDFDTAIGINNEGALVFGYELEDIDHLESGADIYNGQQSVLWVNLRKLFFDAIREMYQELRSTGVLSYDVVEKMFEDHQNKWPEALCNEDTYFKYILPFVKDGSNYLDMAQGLKVEQRKWWLYNRFRYEDSKYNAGDALTEVITIRGYAKDDITVIPYADIYPSIKYGSYLVQKRGHRGVATALECPLSNVNDTEIYIYSASQLASIGDVSGLKPGLVDISMATKLQELKVGDGDPSYSNGNLTSLSMGNNVLLKKVDVRNCPNLVSAIDMSGCTNVEEVYFDGSGITSLSLPNGGVVKKLHLPETITNLTILNQTAITEFVLPSYENLTTIRLENVSSVIDPIDILHSIPAGSRVRIIGFNINVQTVDDIHDFLDYLNTMRGLDENGQNTDKAQVQGTIHIPFITGEVLGQFQKDYPNITITYDHISSYIYYYNFDGSELLHTESIEDEGDGIHEGTYERESTAQYNFTFAGWSTLKDSDPDPNATKKITADRIVYAAYTRVVRRYTVTWEDYDGWILETDENVPYGTMPEYNRATPTNPSGQISNGWDPEVAPVTGDIIYVATYLPEYTVWFYIGETLAYTAKVVMGHEAVYVGETPVDPDGYGAEFLGWARSYGAHVADNDFLKNIRQNTYAYAAFAANYDVPTSTDVSDAYGIEWDLATNGLIPDRVGLSANFTNPNPAKSVAEVGYSPFDNIMPWSGMKRYNVVNGEIAYSENDPRFSQTLYDTVVYIPEFYYTAIKNSETGRWLWAVSPTAKKGYCKHPGSGRYVGRYHTSGDETAVKSVSGVIPLVYTSLNEFRDYSHNKGSHWYNMDFASWSAIQMLYLIEFANFEVQDVLGTGYAGPSSSVIEVGGTDAAAYHTLNISNDHNQYRWIEDPYSNCRDWVDGFLGSRTSMYVGVKDDGYTGSITGLNNLSLALPKTGPITAFAYSDAAAWAFIPEEADTEKPVGIDYVSSSPARCPLIVGGTFDMFRDYGMFHFYASVSSGGRLSSVGSRLMYVVDGGNS